MTDETMTDDELDAGVLEILAGQSPDYLIHPTAAAFVLAGLHVDDVAASLARLAEAGHAREDEVVMMHETDGHEVVAAGWCATEEGHAAYAERTSQR